MGRLFHIRNVSLSQEFQEFRKQKFNFFGVLRIISHLRLKVKIDELARNVE